MIAWRRDEMPALSISWRTASHPSKYVNFYPRTGINNRVLRALLEIGNGSTQNINAIGDKAVEELI
jgi:hypothetical protein